jgi:glucuronoarabinoxylan endo-1,4-beta-xylanase
VHKNVFGKVILAGALLAWGCQSSSGGSGGSTSSGGKQNGGSAAGSGGTTSGGSNAGSGGSTGGKSDGGGGSNKGGAGAGGGGASGGNSGGSTGGASGGNGGSSGGSTGGNTGGSSGGSTGGSSGGSTGAVTVQLDKTRQTIEGFGINDNWMALTDEQAKACFDQNTGLGLTILRVGMSSTGNGFYNNNEASSIAAAKKYGATKIIGSVWSPPGSWKTNGSEKDGGHVKPEYYSQWADKIVTFAKNNSLYAMSVGNEPDFASCGMNEPCNGSYDTTLYTANEMVAFVKVVGPKLQDAGVKVIAPEASEWIHIWSNISATGSEPGKKNSSDPFKCGCFGNSAAATPTGTCASTCTQGNGYDYGHWLYKDKTAWAALDILGVHQYDTQVAEPWPADVNGGKPDKSIWQTEMSGVKWWPEQGPSTDIENGIAVAGWLHNALTVGELNAWIWWWYKAMGETNEGLLLANGTDTKRHYTFGNFTKFVRPGYVRVEVAGGVPSDVLLSAYKGNDGTVALVAINKVATESKFSIAIAGGTPTSCTPNVTSKDDNLKAGTAVPVSDGKFTATLIGKSVTTFVCK